MPPAAPSVCPTIDLVELIGDLGVRAEDGLDRGRLVAVVEYRRGAMRVDVGDLVWCDAGFLQRALDGAHEARAARSRLGDVVRVCRGAVADQLGIDARATRPRVFFFLQQQHACALSHHEAIALASKGRLALAGRRCGGRARACLEGRDAHRGDRALGAAGEHGVGVAAPDHLARLTDGACARRAGGDGGEVRPARVDRHRDDTGGDVGDEHA